MYAMEYFFKHCLMNPMTSYVHGTNTALSFQFNEHFTKYLQSWTKLLRHLEWVSEDLDRKNHLKQQLFFPPPLLSMLLCHQKKPMNCRSFQTTLSEGRSEGDHKGYLVSVSVEGNNKSAH